MSIRVVFHDDSSEKLLDSTNNEVEEDEEESLASLLGITGKDVVSLDDHTDTEKTETEYIDDDSGEENDKDAQSETKEEEEEETTENDDTVDVKEIEADVDKEEDDAEADLSDGNNARDYDGDNDNNESDDDKKRESRLDFKKLFGFNRSSSAREDQPSSSTEDTRVAIEDEGEHATEEHQLITPQPPSSGARPLSPVILDRRKKEHQVLKKQVSQRGKLMCGIVIIVFLLGLTLGMLALGWWYGITDLYIIGGIFGGGSAIFIVIFVFIRCTSNSSVEYITLYKAESPENKV